MAKRALILYWHGLGDVIILTPILRHLYKQGYKIDLMCRSQVRTSHLLDACPYVSGLIDVPNPWQSSCGFMAQVAANIAYFKSICDTYDWNAACQHKGIKGLKVDHNFKECKINCIDRRLETFVTMKDKLVAMNYLKKHGYECNNYIFNHTAIDCHKWHTWDSNKWIGENLPALRILDTGEGGNSYMLHKNINVTFAIAKNARYRVLSSSVMVHACEAMNLSIEVINYGKSDRKVWPDRQDLVKRIRESNKWI